jgi:hypothetical protein
MTKPQILWAAISPQGRIYVHSVRRTRDEAINAFMGVDATRPWSWWRKKHGWRCIKVKVTPV